MARRSTLLLSVACAAAAALTLPAGAAAVISGKPADPARYPFVGFSGSCTGFLVAPDRVATAAHCTSPVLARADLPRWRFSRPAIRIKAVRVSSAPAYASQIGAFGEEPERVLGSDVSIHQLARPVPGVRPVDLATPEELASLRRGTRTKLTGLGVTSLSDGARAGTLRAVSLALETDAGCRRRLRRYSTRTAPYHRWYEPATNLCTIDADGRRPYRSGCYGDSGAPLLATVGGRRVVVGADSWGVACGTRGGDPEVFAEVPALRDVLLAPAPAWRPLVVRPATVVGDPRVGTPLRCDVAFTEVPATVDLTWDVDGDERAPAADGSYVPTAADRGDLITCQVIQGTAGGSTGTRSDPVKIR